MANDDAVAAVGCIGGIVVIAGIIIAKLAILCVVVWAIIKLVNHFTG